MLTTNKIDFIEENGILTVEHLTFPTYHFEIVDAVPLGYSIWNISGMPEGYLPLCRLSSHQPFEGAQNIEEETLKAIKCEGANEMIRAAGCGFGTLAKAEAFLKKHLGNKRKMYELNRICAAISYMRELRWT